MTISFDLPRDITEQVNGTDLNSKAREALLVELRHASLLDMNDCAIDGSHVRALKGGLTSGLHQSTAAARAASTM